MIKRTITFEDSFTGEQLTRDFFFHLTKADIIRIVGRDREGDWEKYVKNIAESNDTDRVLDFIELIIKQSVGKKTPEGTFIKPKEFAEEFIASDAYGELFIELVQDEDAARRFFEGVAPRGSKTPDGVKAVAQGPNRNQRRHGKK